MTIEFINDGFKKISWRERIIRSFGKDPLLCPKCREEMLLWRIWHPKYGTIFELARDGPFENAQEDNEKIIAKDKGDIAPHQQKKEKITRMAQKQHNPGLDCLKYQTRQLVYTTDIMTRKQLRSPLEDKRDSLTIFNNKTRRTHTPSTMGIHTTLSTGT